MTFWPQRIEFSEVLINSIWSLIAWVVWSVFILILAFLLDDVINISWNFKLAQIWIENGWVFPLVLSVITFLGILITMYSTYRLLNITSENKYKRNAIISWQILFFALFTYIFITPVYIYAWIINYKYIMYVFIAHILIWTFWTSVIIEILNSYRYILLWIYWSFIWLFTSICLSLLIFTYFSNGTAKLISLIVLLPLINFTTTFFKNLFELVYYSYYKYTTNDQLWDIFYQIEQEDKERELTEEQKNTI